MDLRHRLCGRDSFRFPALHHTWYGNCVCQSRRGCHRPPAACDSNMRGSNWRGKALHYFLAGCFSRNFAHRCVCGAPDRRRTDFGTRLVVLRCCDGRRWLRLRWVSFARSAGLVCRLLGIDCKSASSLAYGSANHSSTIFHTTPSISRICIFGVDIAAWRLLRILPRTRPRRNRTGLASTVASAVLDKCVRRNPFW